MTSPQGDSLSGQSQGDVVRFIFEPRKNVVYLALLHTQRGVAVSHGFDPADSRIELTLTAEHLKSKGPAAQYDLVCHVKSSRQAAFWSL